MNNNLVGLLLAAGSSHRFGSNKLLYPWSNGTPMIIAAAKKLSVALPNSIAVINPDTPELKPLLTQLGFKVVINHNTANGIGSSIARGVDASQEAAGWIITLADMPYIKSETIRMIANQLVQDASIVAPLYQQQRGHPVGFDKQYRDELLQLDSDIGARNIIKQHQEHLRLIETSDEGMIRDIDALTDIVNVIPASA